jgi:hypothetical protein
MPCVIKFDHDDGVKLPKHKIVTWCGKTPSNWMFQDAQHAALATEQGSRIAVCRSCRAKIKQALYGEDSEKD